MTQALVDNLIKQVEGHLHGAGREKILGQLEQNPTADTLAQITYDLIISMDQQAAERGAPLEIDVLMGVATETIDMLIEILNAMGTQFKEDEMRDETLLKIVLLHMQAVEGDPEQEAAAKEMFAAMTEDGTVQQSMDYVNKRADATPQQMQAAAQKASAPKQNPVSAGVSRGLMQPGVAQ